MPVPPRIANLIEQLHQEINQTEQAVTEGLQIARLKLNNYLTIRFSFKFMPVSVII